MKHTLFILIFLVSAMAVWGQSDSSSVKNSSRTYSHRDSVYLAKLNSNGNLMIAGGVGLCGVGGYLIYQGWKIYNNPVTNIIDPNAQKTQTDLNHKQGTIYYVAGGVGIAGGIILTALGAKNKVEFKQRKRLMELQSGILDNGSLGLALNF